MQRIMGAAEIEELRNRLIAMLLSVPPIEVPRIIGRAQGKGSFIAGHYADHLIKNGVTLEEQIRDRYWATEVAYKNGYTKGRQEAAQWVSVAEDKPKVAGEYVVCIVGASMSTTLWYNPVEEVWFRDDYRDRYPVTHWMPLPELPEGK